VAIRSGAETYQVKLWELDRGSRCERADQRLFIGVGDFGRCGIGRMGIGLFFVIFRPGVGKERGVDVVDLIFWDGDFGKYLVEAK